jgi:hypothetical protein
VHAKGEIVLEMMKKRRPLWGKEREEYGSIGQLWGAAAWPAAAHHTNTCQPHSAISVPSTCCLLYTVTIGIPFASRTPVPPPALTHLVQTN